MVLIAALFAVGTAYLAYFNFIIVRRVHAGEVTAVSRHLLVKSVIALCAYSAATCLFAISAAVSSMAVLTDGVLVALVAGVTSLVFSVIRPRR